jgi:hypothetical protein
MSVRAKFRVVLITDVPEGGQDHKGVSKTITLEPVTSPQAVENTSFFESVPTAHVGMIELVMVRSDAALQFRDGSEHFVDFTPAT